MGPQWWLKTVIEQVSKSTFRESYVRIGQTILKPIVFCIFYALVQEIEIRVSYVLGKCSTTDLHPQALKKIFFKIRRYLLFSMLALNSVILLPQPLM